MRNKYIRFRRRVDKKRSLWRRTVRNIARHPIMVPGSMLLALCAVSGVGLILLNQRNTFQPLTSYMVIVSHDHEKETVPTHEPTVGSLLHKLHITVNKGDVVEPSESTRITQDNFRINVYRGEPVEIVKGSQRTFAFSAATTPRAVAQQAGVTVYPEDAVKFVPVTDFLTQGTVGQEVVIDPATPVNLNLYGTPTVIRTRATTVGQLLAEKGITLAKGDTLVPSNLDTPIIPNEQIFVIRNGTTIQTTTQSIPMPIQTITDDSLTFGTTAIRQQGSPGTEVLTYQVNLQNGQPTSRTLIQTVVTMPPVTEIVARGQAVQIPADKEAVMAEAGIPAGDYAYVNYIVSNESGWCPTKLQGQIGYCPGYPPNSMPSYLGYGLGQATPGGKMAAFGGDWETNPVTQLRWATSYADSKYGSWSAAYNFWYGHHYW